MEETCFKSFSTGKFFFSERTCLYIQPVGALVWKYEMNEKLKIIKVVVVARSYLPLEFEPFYPLVNKTV